MIYLDYQATTPLAPEARAVMLPFLEEKFGNPHSPHRMGRETAAVIEAAREAVAEALGPGYEQGRILFTSGATESANWAIQRVMAMTGGERTGLVTIATEHACVLDSVRHMARHGADAAILPADSAGIVDLDDAMVAIEGDTALVAAMLVNNEIGVMQPIAELSALARKAGALFFCDAAQGFGRVPIPMEACDMIALSAHKIHGPKGIGALWLRDGVELPPLLFGGGQEGGIRSGTLAPALCAGFGAAARLAVERGAADTVHIERLWGKATALLDDQWALNGASAPRYHGNLNIRAPGIDASRLISELRGIAFSAGSACASGSGRPSHVLKALGLGDAEAKSSIRLGFGRYTTEDEIETAISQINEAAIRQRAWAE
jgi:cysteine desulfurase